MTDLGTLGGTQGFPYSLNNRGEVVESSANLTWQAKAEGEQEQNFANQSALAVYA
jgi:uncharacterized membrane protein